MLTSLSDRTVSTIATQETEKFTIAATGKAFKILIDRLYSDKVKAVVREIWTNAYDSHIMAGCIDKPFDCHLPTTWEPEFSVRDYGVGLTHEKVMHLYTTVFGSTKDGSNEQVGAFGLGSKSPFAYTDTFTVTAFDGEVKRMYSAYIGSDHVPRISFMGEEASDEQRGVMISFPVKADDCEDFHRAASEVIEGFDVWPSISGVAVAKEPKRPIFEGKGWKIYRSGGPMARQGCVIYPLDRYAVLGASSEQRSLLDSALVLDFAIGELEVSASREALGYDERTSKNILARIDAVRAEIGTQLAEQLSTATTYWEAMIAYSNLSSAGLPGAIKQAIQSTLFWKGRKLFEQRELAPALDAARGKVSASLIENGDMRKARMFKWEPSSRIRVNVSNVSIYVEDTSRPISVPANRIKYHWHLKGQDYTNTLWIKADVNSMSFKRFYAVFGRPQFVLVNDLPKPPVNHATAPRKPVRMRELVRSTMTETDVDLDAGGVYVRMYRGEIVGPRGMPVDGHCLRNARDQMIKLGALDANIRIIGVPASFKNFEAEEGWVNFWDLARQTVSGGYDPQAASDAEAYNQIINENGGAIGVVNYALKNGLVFTGAGPALHIVLLLEEAAGKVATLGNIRTMRDLHQTVTGEKTYLDPTVKTDHLCSAFFKAYPMARFALNDTYASRLNDGELKMITDYVNQIDLWSPLTQYADSSSQAA